MKLKPDLDAMLLRQLYLERYGNGQASDMIKLVRNSDAQIKTLLRDFFEDASQSDIDAFLKQNRRNKNVREFMTSIGVLLDGQKKIFINESSERLELLAASMIDHTYKAMGSEAKKRPSASKILTYPVVGLQVDEAWKNLSDSFAANLVKDLINAQQQNLNPVLAYAGTKDQNYRDGLLSKRNNKIKSLSITQSFGVGAKSRSESFGMLGVKYEIITATLDFRTTAYCRGVDTDVYHLGEGPIPPFHWGCRTLRLPWTGELEERPYVKDRRVVAKIPKGSREGKIGQTTGSYQDFFDRLSKSQQREILGYERFKLYDSGKVKSLREFANPNTGKQYTLDQLQRASP